MKTEVCITVDVEFSIAGAFAQPQRYSPLADEVVHCWVDGKGQGLDFVLDSLASYSQHATFFTEALQAVHFGDGPMACIAQRIASAGHDVQLHLHPCWLHFQDEKWRQSGFVPNDYCSGRTDAELDQMIKMGIDAFKRWGITRPVALRTGGFRTDRAVYRAMARAGLDLASNIGLAVMEPAEPELRMYGGACHHFDGVLEVPVFSYKTPRLSYKDQYNWRLFSITATSKPEIEAILWTARHNGARKVVVLTHPFEFIKQKGFRFDKLRINRVNQQRFLHLLEFLKDNSDDFVAVTFGERRDEWHQAAEEVIIPQPLRMPRRLALMRTMQNICNGCS